MHGRPLSNILTITTQISCLKLDQGQVVTTLIVISGITSSSFCNWYHCPHYCDTRIIIGDVMTIKWRHIENSHSKSLYLTRISHPFKRFYRHSYPRLNWAEPWCQKRYAEVRRRHQNQEIKHQPRIDWLKPEPGRGIIKGSYSRGVKLSLNRLKISRKNDKNSGR